VSTFCRVGNGSCLLKRQAAPRCNHISTISRKRLKVLRLLQFRKKLQRAGKLTMLEAAWTSNWQLHLKALPLFLPSALFGV
jgi:hypothetical protein